LKIIETLVVSGRYSSDYNDVIIRAIISVTCTLEKGNVSPINQTGFYFMKRKRIIIFCAAMLGCLLCKAQDEWTLKVNKAGIEIYTKASLLNSDLKAVRVNCVLPATLSQIVAVILDVNTGAEWVYSTKSSTLLKQVTPAELYYYSEVSLPWPISDRDFIAHLITAQDPRTKIVTIDGPTVTNYLPQKKNIVRVKQSSGKWIITPAGKKSVRIEYTLETDPGGSLPSWLVNLFVTKGPMETFKKLKLQVQKPAYQNVHLPFITD
jgi:hypothetical protein